MIKKPDILTFQKSSINAKFGFTIFCYFLIIAFTSGQKLYFQSYASAEGLSQNSIYSIAETPEGFMWFGTQDGINRYDGKNFKSFTPSIKDDQNSQQNFSKMITALYYDESDFLWVGTTNELLIYDRYTEKFKFPKDIFGGIDLPKGMWYKKLLLDKNNNFWIATQDNGLYCYSKTKDEMKLLTFSDKTPKKILNIVEDDEGNIWMSTTTEIYKGVNGVFTPINISSLVKSQNVAVADIAIIDQKLWVVINGVDVFILDINKSTIPYTYQNFKTIYKGNEMLADVRIIHQSDKNTAWLGSRSDGLLKINLKDNTYVKAGAAGTSYSLKSQFILSFYTNRQKITWIGLSGDLAKYDQQKIQFKLWRNEAQPNKPAPDNKIFSIYTDNDHELYMGTLYGGLLYCNTKSEKMHYYKPPSFLNNSSESKNIYSVIKGEGNLLWLATKAGLFSFDKKSKQFKQYIEHGDEQTVELTVLIKLDNTNKLLVAGYNGGLRLFNLVTKSFEKCNDQQGFLSQNLLRVRYMQEEENGNIYMSTEAQNLVQYNYISGEFTTYPELKRISGISRHFWLDDNNFWIATDDGLIQANTLDLKIKKLWNTENGLPNNYIYAVVADNDRRLWISTNAGLALLDTSTGIVRKYTENDGLQGLEFNTASFAKTEDGKIWFGGVNGFNLVDPALSVQDTFSPSPLITDIKVMNTHLVTDISIPYLDNIRLTHDKNFVSFEFQSPNYSQTENIIYHYKMIGVDSGWVNNGTRSFVSYTQLKPGTYKFMVKSANSHHIWSAKPRILTIIISPPWYLTLTFMIAVTLSCLWLLYFIIKERINTIKARENLKRTKLEAEMQALRSQMNPHFIFNSLNSINAFIVENKPNLASEYLTKFSKLMRFILENSKQEHISLEKEMEALRLYLLLEKIRFNDSFSFNIDIQADIDDSTVFIPPLIIQPFVENAVWHGLMHLDEGGLVTITVTAPSDDFLHISVSDNGIGRQKAKDLKTKESHKDRSYGMQITKERIQLQHPENQITIIDHVNENNGKANGTEVLIKIKI
ncbi:MAG: histidine kinase [Saprospiraceae bacterium]|nr:histidine kinase [Saprospiraceae bacterium]